MHFNAMAGFGQTAKHSAPIRQSVTARFSAIGILDESKQMPYRQSSRLHWTAEGISC
jgi:hypothetical protein